MKASIKRPFQSISEDLRTALPAIHENKDSEIEYVVNIKNQDQHLWPPHLSAVYISDRIKDIKEGRNTDSVNVVITVRFLEGFSQQVPRYFNEVQIVDFLNGLKAVNIEIYILLYETDAIAINYGYFRNFHDEFNKPVYILFVGVGFIESQAFVVRFSEVEE